MKARRWYMCSTLLMRLWFDSTWSNAPWIRIICIWIHIFITEMNAYQYELTGVWMLCTLLAQGSSTGGWALQPGYAKCYADIFHLAALWSILKAMWSNVSNVCNEPGCMCGEISYVRQSKIHRVRPNLEKAVGTNLEGSKAFCTFMQKPFSHTHQQRRVDRNQTETRD